jgi:hydrogenase maturation protease
MEFFVKLEAVLKDTLLLGYGNPDREDDGVAWHILRALATKLGLEAPESYEQDFPQSADIDFIFQLQLTPELAEEIYTYKHVCFFDAHTGNIPEEVRLIDVQSDFQRSPLTHHLTPQSLMAICKTLYGNTPAAALISVHGYQFRFSRSLSENTAALVPQAVDQTWNWLAMKNVVQEK